MAASTVAARTLPRAGCSRIAPRVWVPGVDTPKRLSMLEPLRERERTEQRRRAQTDEWRAARQATQPAWWVRVGDWLVRVGDDAMHRHSGVWTLPR